MVVVGVEEVEKWPWKSYDGLFSEMWMYGWWLMCFFYQVQFTVILLSACQRYQSLPYFK